MRTLIATEATSKKPSKDLNQIAWTIAAHRASATCAWLHSGLQVSPQFIFAGLPTGRIRLLDSMP